MQARVESDEEFDRRIEEENRLALSVACPLTTCAAEPGKACVTDSGLIRIRHCRRLWLAQKQAP